MACTYTRISSCPTLGNEYGITLPFTLVAVRPIGAVISHTEIRHLRNLIDAVLSNPTLLGNENCDRKHRRPVISTKE